MTKSDYMLTWMGNVSSGMAIVLIGNPAFSNLSLFFFIAALVCYSLIFLGERSPKGSSQAPRELGRGRPHHSRAN